MEIYLIRHTTPQVEKGVCYGQTDVNVSATFLEEAAVIKRYLPDSIQQVHSSPLQRCTKLAGALFPRHQIRFHTNLKELNFGSWEMQYWDALPKDVLDPWMKDFVHVPAPNGESYLQLYHRVRRQFRQIIQLTNDSVAIVTHGGVIRSLLSYVTQTPLKDSFKTFNLHYGGVVKLYRKNETNFAYEVMYNAPAER